MSQILHGQGPTFPTFQTMKVMEIVHHLSGASNNFIGEATFMNALHGIKADWRHDYRRSPPMRLPTEINSGEEGPSQL